MANEINLQEVWKFLGKSKHTDTRYIKKSLLNSEKVIRQKGMILLS